MSTMSTVLTYRLLGDFQYTNINHKNCDVQVTSGFLFFIKIEVYHQMAVVGLIQNIGKI